MKKNCGNFFFHKFILKKLSLQHYLSRQIKVQLIFDNTYFSDNKVESYFFYLIMQPHL